MYNVEFSLLSDIITIPSYLSQREEFLIKVTSYIVSIVLKLLHL